MDASAKGRERLKAVHMESEQAGVMNTLASSVSLDRLSNPFANALATPPVMNDPPTLPRFDFYTDPLSAFSTSKRRNIMNQGPGGNDVILMTPSQIQMHSPQDQCLAGRPSSWRSPMARPLPPPTGIPISGHTAWNQYGSQPGYGVNSSSSHSVRHMRMHYLPEPFEGNMYVSAAQSCWRHSVGSPFALPAITPVAGYNSCNTNGSKPGYGSQSGYGVNLSSPHPIHQLGNSLVHQLGNSPSYGYGRGSGSSPNCGSDSYKSGYGRSSSCSLGDGGGRGPRPFVRRGYNSQNDTCSNLGMDKKSEHNAHHDTLGLDERRGHNSHDDITSNTLGVGKGRSLMFYDDTPSPDTGLDKGGCELHGGTPNTKSGIKRRRPKSHHNVSPESKAKQYYSKSMLEDPWRHLKPVVKDRIGVMTNATAKNSEQPWLPKSVLMKEAKGVKETFKLQNDISLAMCLADSLKEATNDSTNV